MGNLWVAVVYNTAMTEHTILESFIVRIYRIDTNDPGKITGLVEVLDGSGDREPFAALDELGALLNRRAGKQKKRGRRKT